MSNSDLADRMRRSVMDSFERIVDSAIDNRADALIISGDIYDDANELPSTRMWFTGQLSRVGIPVFICRGNHDSSASWDQAIPYPANVHEFGTEAERIEINDWVEIVGISYSEPHEKRNLAKLLSGDPSKFTIACLHCDIDTASEGYPYAPCSMADLSGRGVDYWALGHIHKGGILSTRPYVVYPGNIQGRSFKETGKKGAYLVKVSDMNVVSADLIPTQTYIWENLTADITGKTIEDVLAELKEKTGRNVICRLTFIGHGDLDRMLRSSSDDVAMMISERLGCIVSDISVKTTSTADLDSLVGRKDMPAAVAERGLAVRDLGRDDIIDIICENKMAAKYRNYYEGMSDEELRSLVMDSIYEVLARMEAVR